MRLAFVIPWLGGILGGAERLAKRTAEELNKSGFEVEILTTCVKDFYSDWSKNHYDEGVYDVDGLKVRRFKVRKRDTKTFDEINFKVMNKIPVNRYEEEIFIREMINSPNLYKYIKNNDNYNYFIFTPYMFGTTYYGSLTCPEKAILVPCLHDEPYAYMSIYKKMFENVKGAIFYSYSEEKLAKRLYDLNNVHTEVLGGGVDTNFKYNAKRFCDKYNIEYPFILYVGRKNVSKGVGLLINYIIKYKKLNENDLKLVLIGPGKVEIPEKHKKDIIDLGFVSEQDKYDAYAAATIFCNPSQNESFSLVLMESWLCETPALVNAKCEVTKEHCIRSNAGLYFEDYWEFEACINFYLENERVRKIMGRKGKKYVMDNYSWKKIVNKYKKFFENLEEKA